MTSEQNTPESLYLKRMRKVCDYIYEHLSEPLPLDRLCSEAHFSKYHFHRQFTNLMGVSVYRFIQQARLKRAAYQLVFHTDVKIIEVALQAGFETPESFTRCFKKQFKTTPSNFRKHPEWCSWHQHFQFIPTLETVKMHSDINPEIINFPQTHLAAYEHRGDPNRLNDSIAIFIDWRKETGLSPVQTSRTFGLAYDDPTAIESKDFRFDICCSVPGSIPENSQGLISKILPGGRCAKIRHLGAHEKMTPKIYALYGEWLPKSGEELRDFPCFFEYRNFFPEVAEHELITDIYLPLK